MSVNDRLPRCACPCCGCQTLMERADFEVCGECGWEDDGQDDHDADVVRGGPNGRLSLTQARIDYQEAVREADLQESVVSGGEGLWWSRALNVSADDPGDVPR
ncbi:CPCC family cysteine-rich protein [Kitasatospora sp. NPDC096077]|uniref:CPCC family cysteine-rich protein n=1 Tax=Kitasatospora sp. NPDC096077 TaxID=3155544 RepID=UPI00332BF765